MPPFPITPALSMNRVYITALPGIPVDDGVLGQRGYDLLAAHALSEQIRSSAAFLGLDAAFDEHALHTAFDACFASARDSVRAAAEALAQRMGRRLGYVLLALRRGDAANRAARPEWEEAIWMHWAQINRLWLGGGLVSGALGPRLARHAEALLHQHGCPDYHVAVSLYAAALPLVGAARHAPPGCEAALVFDFGGTLVKRGVAAYRGGALVSLRLLPSLPVSWADYATWDDLEARRLFEAMLAAIGATQAETGCAPAVLISIASYVERGQPMTAQGGTYMHLRRLGDSAEAAFAGRLGLPARLLHDGSAAGAVYAGENHTAVLMMGTALGIGFPPDTPAGLRAIGAEFALGA